MTQHVTTTEFKVQVYKTALQAPVVRKVDSAIHWIAQLVVVILNCWRAIYPVDSAISSFRTTGARPMGLILVILLLGTFFVSKIITIC